MRLDKLDVYFWALLIVSGFVMYYVYIVVNPTFEILQNVDRLIDIGLKQNNLTIEQNKEIINNTNRNADIITAYINKSIANQDENLYYLATILNQSNVIGNQTADLILESINKTTELNANISSKNDIQRALIVMDITTALDHIDEQLDRISEQNMNITKNQTLIQANQTGQKTGEVSSFLGGPLILNESLPDALSHNETNVTMNTTG